MAEVKRYAGRSFSKVEQQEASASKAFDDIIAKAKATNVKWGNASYIKPRGEDEIDNKKNKVDMGESSDPFSFEFDSERSPKKKQVRLQPKTVVLQPAVRITSVASTKAKRALDNTDEEDLTVRKGNVRTYSKGGGVKIIQEDTSHVKTDSYLKPNKKQAQGGDSVHGIPQIRPQEMIDDPEDGLYIESDDGNSTGPQDAESFLLQEEEENIFKRPKRETFFSSDGEVTVKFRSHYLNPEVYSKFTENVKPRDPVGRMSNSTVVHKNVLKHDSGTTLIVVCSPKVGNEDLKQSNTQSKYFKDNIKDLVKSQNKQNKPVAQLAKAKKTKSMETKKKKDPFDLDDDLQGSVPTPSDKSASVKAETLNVNLSPAVETQHPHTSAITGSMRQSRTVTPPESDSINIEEVVKSLKPIQPPKYHRIFRSRNKGFREQKEDSNESPVNECTNNTPDNIAKTEANEKSCEILPMANMSSQQNREGQDTENEMEAAQCASQESQQDSGSSLQLPLLINLTGEKVNSDLSNIDQPEISDSQTTYAESSSQEMEPQAKKPKVLKPPPAERKIFRARGAKPTTMKKIFSSPKKVTAVYNVRSWQEDEEMSEIHKVIPADVEHTPPVPEEPPKLKPVTQKQNSEPKGVHTEMPRLTRAVHWQGYQGDDAYTSVHVSSEHRDLFTVVKNVKEAHECQEHGETQEFDDDIEYLLAGIESIEPMSTRCLSCVGLAQKSTIPAFRMHLRAHGTVTKIFSCLQDAASDPSLALCTSALMFMLSRDRLNMDLDQQSLNLMLRLLGVDQQEDMATTCSPTAERALKRNRDRVHQVYQEFLQQSGTKQDAIDSEYLSTGNLAMESLLSLTSRQAGEWFKEELRTLGALDHIVDTVCSCIASIGDNVNVLTNSNIENLKKVDRCLRVLENVTYLNADNQSYLISYKDSSLIPSFSRALKTCQTCLSIYPLITETSSSGKVDKESFGWVVYSCILAILRVLLNLTHENECGCMKIGGQPTVMETVLLCILQLPQYVPSDLRFDLYVLSLGLLINLVEHSDNNRHHLLMMQTSPMYENPRQDTFMLAYLSLVEVFKYREIAAQQLEEEPKTSEKSPNKSGEWQELDSGLEWVADSVKKVPTVKKGLIRPGASENGEDLDNEETFTKALHTAGKHMENSIVAAYVALLIGCLTHDSLECVANVKCQLPQNNFDGMIYMLKKFLGFMNLTSGAESAGGKSIERVIEMLEKC